MGGTGTGKREREGSYQARGAAGIGGRKVYVGWGYAGVLVIIRGGV